MTSGKFFCGGWDGSGPGGPSVLVVQVRGDRAVRVDRERPGVLVSNVARAFDVLAVVTLEDPVSGRDESVQTIPRGPGMVAAVVAVDASVRVIGNDRRPVMVDGDRAALMGPYVRLIGEPLGCSTVQELERVCVGLDGSGELEVAHGGDLSVG